MKLYKGVFKGGGSVQPPPKKKFRFIFKSEGKEAKIKTKKMKRDVRGLLVNTFWELRYFQGELKKFW